MRLINAIIILVSCWAALLPVDVVAEYGVFGPSEFSKDKKEVVLVPWNSESGKKRFERARYKQDFFQLAQTYQPQINPLYCGIASSVIVLNALRQSKATIPSQPELEIPAPPSFGGGQLSFPSYSQLTFLNSETERVKSRQIIELKNLSKNGEQDSSTINPGLSLADLQGMLHTYHADAKLEYAADEDILRGAGRFRKTLRVVLSESASFLVVNFKGNTLGAATSGHITPVGAYDSTSDSVLLLDVASHKNPWYWVPVKHLYQAMHIKDGIHYRGYLVISEPK